MAQFSTQISPPTIPQGAAMFAGAAAGSQGVPVYVFVDLNEKDLILLAAAMFIAISGALIVNKALK